MTERRTTLKRTAHLIGALGVVTILSGSSHSCGEKKSPQSGYERTDDIRATFVATATGDGSTRVEAQLEVADTFGFDDVLVSSTDSLRAYRTDHLTVSRDTQVMRRDQVGLRIRYHATFSGDEKNTLLEVDFNRSGKRPGKVTARGSFVRMPTPFELDWVEDPVTLAPAPVNFSRSSATPYFVVWDPYDSPGFDFGDTLAFEVTGPCIQRYAGTLDWPNGEDVLQLTRVLSPPTSAQSCALRVEMRLSRTEEVDSAFASGSFVGEQIRVMTLISTP